MALLRCTLARTMQQMNHHYPLFGSAFARYASRDCKKDSMPRCSPKNIAASPCAQSKKKGEKKDKDKKDEKPKPTSMWENPECCLDPCPDVLPRFDDLYYKPSDKSKAKYRQTWVECPDIQIRPKKICCFENVKYPPIERRVKKSVPKTACPQGDDGACKKKTDYRCPKLSLRGCKSARSPPTCKPNRGPMKCKKVCAPYPAYSECTKKAPKPLRAKECRCLDVVPMCEVWAEWRKQKTAMKG